MNDPGPPEAFTELAFYSAHFMDLSLWKPIVERVASFHDLKCQRILPGLPGTYPTFLVELINQADLYSQRSVVIKFFGPLFDGPTSYQVERAMSNLLAQQPLSIPSPRVLVEGQLNEQWSYLVYEQIPGISIGQLRHELSKETWEGVARQMGRFMKEFYQISACSQLAFLKPRQELSWDTFISFLQNQRDNCLVNHRQWHDLPSHLLNQLSGFILPVEQLLDLTSTPHLIHADLTGDHLLGRFLENPVDSQNIGPEYTGPIPVEYESRLPSLKRWQCLAIIDWGDCRVGNILYELVALHCDPFQADRHLLRLCLEAYGLPIFYQQNFTHKALSMMLLHQFPMPAAIYAPHKTARTLEELAERLFNLV